MPGTTTDERWQRLIEEFRRQEVARAVEEERRWVAERPWRTFCLTLLAVVGGLWLVAFGWWTLERAIRSDASRCEVTTVERAEVRLGGWVEPDRCIVHDLTTGEEVAWEGGLAGPVTRTYGDVLADNALRIAVAATAGIAVATAAIAQRWGAPLRG